MTLLDKIAEHYGDGQRCKRGVWLRDSLISIYVRIGRHSGIRDCVFIEIANLCVRKPSLRGKGHFTEFLAEVEKIGPVYIENVLEPRFADFFRRRGYLISSDGWGVATPCFYRVDTIEVLS